MAKEVVFKPQREISDNSNVRRFMNKHGIEGYDQLIRQAAENIEWYWDAVNTDLGLKWFQPYTKILDSSNGKAWTKWFIGGKCNIAYNCLDRHIEERKGRKTAIFWEGEDGTTRKVSYNDLFLMVNRCANALKSMGIAKGDVVGIYMPMIPEAIVSMLACSKIGAIYSVVFSGFSAPALSARLNDAGAKVLITADGYYRKEKLIRLKDEADAALESSPIVNKMVVCKYAKIDLHWDSSRDVWYEDLTKHESSSCKCEVMDSEDPLFILYTSGTTGKPKGTLHVHGGFMVFAAQQAAYLIDQKFEDVLFWPADIGWITGQTWSVYGSLILGGTSVIYDGAPDYPDSGRWFKMIDKYKVTIFGTSPTAIRLFMQDKDDVVNRCDLRPLRVLASTGELINRDEWLWFYENIGNKRCPVMNLSGGTEIGGAIVSPLPIMSQKPATVGGPVPGFDVDVFDEKGTPIREASGYLVIKQPWPGMTRGIWKDPDRYINTYWSKYDDVWFHGDWAFIDSDGFWFLHGRVDDVIKVSGHRIGSAEVESALSDHPAVVESAAIGIPHEIKGEVILVYVTLRDGFNPENSIKEELREQVVQKIGKLARPEEIRFVSDLPKTRTGKIVRRLIRAKVLGVDVGDISGLENPKSIQELEHAL